MTWPEALALTLAVEVPLAALLARPLRLPLLRAVAAAVAASLLTHPALFFGVRAASPALGYWPAVAAGEALVVLAEAGIYAALVPAPARSAAALSLVANSASFGTGLAIHAMSTGSSIQA